MREDRRAFLRSSLAIAGAVGVAACARSPAVPKAADAPRWDPTKTWVFCVGLVRWSDDSFETFTDEPRRDVALVDALKARGVDPDRVVYLADDEATRDEIEARFAAHLAKCGPGDLVWVYYAGHGDREESGETYFVPYDADGDDLVTTGWSVSSIVDAIERHCTGARAILSADACYSGALAEEIARRARSGIECAAIASSLASESSTGRWTFTNALVSALEGSALVDLDDDGVLTFDELARYTEREMAFAEGQLSSSATTPRFPRSLALAVAARKKHPRLGEYVEYRRRLHWWPGVLVDWDGARFRVHDESEEASEDAWYAPSDVRPYLPPQIAPGTRVQVHWEEDWYPARVLEGKLGLHHVHYEGYASTWDEWVSRDRIREIGK